MLIISRSSSIMIRQTLPESLDCQEKIDATNRITG